MPKVAGAGETRAPGRGTRMELRVAIADLKDAIAWAKEALAQTPKEQGKIKFETGRNALKVMAVGRDRAACYYIEARIEEEGSALVWSDLACRGISSLSSEYCSIETHDNAVDICSGGFRLALTQVEGEVELPSLRLKSEDSSDSREVTAGDEETTQGSISPSALASAVQRSSFAASKGSENADSFNNVKMDFKQSLIVFTASNRYRLARCEAPWINAGGFLGSALMDAPTLKSIASAFKSLPENEEVKIGFDPENPTAMSFKSSGKLKTVQLSDPSAFPDTDRLFKDEYDVNVILDKDEFLPVFKRVASVTEGEEAVHVDVSPAKCVISAKNSKARAEEVTDAALRGRAVELDFKPSSLIEGLSLIGSSHIRMRMNDDRRIVEFCGQDGRQGQPDLSYRYLVTPITL